MILPSVFGDPQHPFIVYRILAHEAAQGMTNPAIEVQAATPYRHYGALGHNGSDAGIRGGSADAPVRVMTQAQLVDLRAAQRTFDLAYMRTCLSNLCIALLVLRVFEPAFQLVGLAYAVLSVVIGGASFWRKKLAFQMFSQWQPSTFHIVSDSEHETHTTTPPASQRDHSSRIAPLHEATSLLLPRDRQTRSASTTYVVERDTIWTASPVVLGLSITGVVVEGVILLLVASL
ncbi:unnamed protein product [Jaminaea pallidilutea]